MKISNSQFLIIEFIAALMIFLAFTVEYGFGFAPCFLCLIQRLFWLVILLAVPLYLIQIDCKKFNYVSAKVMFFIVLLLLIANSFVAIYHLGLENDIINLAPNCANLIPLFSSGSQIDLLAPYIPCDRPPFTILYISPAGFNLIFTIFTILFMFIPKLPNCDK